jgi:hypothetical protein
MYIARNPPNNAFALAAVTMRLAGPAVGTGLALRWGAHAYTASI